MIVITAVTLLLILAIVWLVLALSRGETAGTDFWFKSVIVLAILMTFGLPRLS